MTIINCKDCGKVCAGSISGQCAACHLKTSRSEVKVAEYLESRPNASLDEIQQATGIARDIIMEITHKGSTAEGIVSMPADDSKAPAVKGRVYLGQPLKASRMRAV